MHDSITKNWKTPLGAGNIKTWIAALLMDSDELRNPDNEPTEAELERANFYFYGADELCRLSLEADGLFL